MSIKILGGTARGLTLAVPVSDNTRPTSVMLKRRVFDANQDLTDYVFIDLCAGVGTIGLEALSRGIKELILVEKDSKAFGVLKKNIELVQKKVSTVQVKAVKKDAADWIMENKTWLSHLADSIIYLDPPYENKEVYQAVIDALKEIGYPGQVWTEACRQKTMHEDEFVSRFYQGKVYRQGTSFIVIGTLNEN